MYKNEYSDYNVTHCWENLKSNHNLKVSYHTFLRKCQKERIQKRKRRNSIKRIYRERLPSPGIMIQFDGSHHEFVKGQSWVLIAGIDDATSEVPYAEFFHEELSINCMKVIRRIIEKKGVPQIIYTDRAGWSGGNKRNEFSQFKRACEELGITVLFANSAQAKGRIERFWGTLQDRIVPELRKNKIKTMDRANEYINNVFLNKYWNKNKTVEPRVRISSYRKKPSQKVLDRTFTFKIERKVSNNNCFSYCGSQYYILGPYKTDLAKRKIEIQNNNQGSWKAFYGGKQLKTKCILDQKKEEQAIENGYRITYKTSDKGPIFYKVKGKRKIRLTPKTV